MKNCLVVIRNKKLNTDMKIIEDIVSEFSAGGYYFEKIAVVAFDAPAEITLQMKECRDNYEHSVVLCELSQLQTVNDYLDKIFSSNGGRENVKTLCFSQAGVTQYREIIGEWNAFHGVCYDKIFIKAVGTPVPLINRAIEAANAISGDITYTVSDNYGDQTIAITYSSNTPKMIADGVLRAFVGALDEYIYALENISLAERLYQLLKLRRMKISVAESFTGGGVCAKLVEVPGVSEVFYEGLNTYSNHSKMDRLGVKELTLKQSGAVSDETAYQMAEGLIAAGNCDISIATTGIAGPKSDNTNKPVGLAFIAIGSAEGVAVYKFNFSGDRQAITQTSINQALFLAYKRLK